MNKKDGEGKQRSSDEVVKLADNEDLMQESAVENEDAKPADDNFTTLAIQLENEP